MQYGDEEIIELLNQHKKYSVGNVYSGIRIGGEMFHFHEYSFFEHKLKIMLPLRFIDTPKEVMKLKYANTIMPQIAKISMDYTMDMSFTLTTEPLREDEIEQRIDEQIHILKRLQPGYEVYEKNIEDTGCIKFGWFDFKGYAMDEILYNITFIVAINGCMMYGRYNCSIYKAQKWKPVVLQMLYSINNEAKTTNKYVIESLIDNF